jgi:hypothetical protein
MIATSPSEVAAGLDAAELGRRVRAAGHACFSAELARSTIELWVERGIAVPAGDGYRLSEPWRRGLLLFDGPEDGVRLDRLGRPVRRRAT